MGANANFKEAQQDVFLERITSNVHGFVKPKYDPNDDGLDFETEVKVSTGCIEKGNPLIQQTHSTHSTKYEEFVTDKAAIQNNFSSQNQRFCNNESDSMRNDWESKVSQMRTQVVGLAMELRAKH
jgi:hypothetical protein